MLGKNRYNGEIEVGQAGLGFDRSAKSCFASWISGTFSVQKTCSCMFVGPLLSWTL